MYTITTAYTRNNYTWTPVHADDLAALTATTVKLLLNTYQDVRLDVSWPNTNESRLDLRKSVHLFTMADRDKTLTAWLNLFTSPSGLPGTDSLKLIQSQAVEFADIEKYHLHRATGNRNYSDSDTVPLGADTDLVLTSDFPVGDSRSTENVAMNCLFAINGQVFEHSWSDGKIFVHDAVKSLRHGRDEVISVLDFSNIGGLDFHTVTTAGVNLLAQNDDDIALRRHRAVISHGGDSRGKIPFMILNGHLHIFKNNYKILDSTKILVEIDMLSELKRAMKYPLTSPPFMDPANVGLNGFRLDTFDPMAFLTETTCLVGFMKSTELSMIREHVPATKLRGAYEFYRVPRGLTFFSDGTLAPWLLFGFNVNGAHLQTIDNYDHHWSFETNPKDEHIVIPHVSVDEQRDNDCLDLSIVEIYRF